MRSLPRAIASSLLAGTFIGLAVSGGIAYATPYDPVLAGIHTLLGIVVLLALGFHLANNFKPLIGYLKVRRRILLAVGVPTLVAGDRHLLLRPIGHGHHSGADGSLTATLEGFDTALELVGPVLVEVGSGARIHGRPAPGALAAAH